VDIMYDLCIVKYNLVYFPVIFYTFIVLLLSGCRSISFFVHFFFPRNYLPTKLRTITNSSFVLNHNPPPIITNSQFTYCKIAIFFSKHLRVSPSFNFDWLYNKQSFFLSFLSLCFFTFNRFFFVN
jgi:hypothetical protein